MNKRLFLIIIFLLIFIIPVKADLLGPSPNHPEREWMVMETPHFLIHYYEGHYRFAKDIAIIAEEAYDKITADLNAKPKEKVPVILTEDEYFNGSADLFKNRITLDPSLARSSYIGIRRFFTHEFTHIITYEALDSGVLLSKFYNATSVPLWFIEGLAQYEAEYWYPSYDRMLCLHTLNHSLLTPSERDSFGILTDSHTGAAGYNEGYAFLKYLFETYGHDKLSEFFANIRSSNNVGFLNSIGLVFDKKLSELEAEWRDYLEQDYKKKTEGKDEFLSGSTPVIAKVKNEANSNLKFSFDEKLIAYLSSVNKAGFTLFRGHVVGMLPLYVALPDNSEKLMVSGGVIDFAWAPDKYHIAYSHTTSNKNGLTTTEISVASFEIMASTSSPTKNKKIVFKNKPEKIITDLQPLYLTWSPDGKTIACTATENEITNVILFDMEKKKKRKNITKTTDNKQYKDLCWSPDGKFIAAIAYYPGDGGNIVLIDPDSGIVRQLTDYAILYNDSKPTWSFDGQYIYFSSDRNGFSNLYRYAIKDRTTEKLTDTYTGVETPYINKEGKTVYYTQFYAKGTEIRKWDLNIQPLPPGTNTNQTVDFDSLKVVPYDEEKKLSDVPDFPSQPYSLSLTPDIIIPITGSDERGDQIGIQAIFNDVLEKHALSLRALYGLASARPSYGVTYINYMFDPTLSSEFHDYANIAITKDGKTPYFEQTQGLSFSIARPLFNKIAEDKDDLIKNGIVGMLDLSFDKLSVLHSFGVQTNDTRQGQNHTINFLLSTDASGGGSFHPQTGYKGTIRLTYGAPFLGSNFDFTQFFIDARTYINIFPEIEHILAIHAVGGVSLGDATPLLLGGAPLNLSLGFQDLIPLRGLNIAELVGDRLGLLSLEYRFPIFKHLDMTSGSLYIDKLYGAVFLDVGDSWFAGERTPALYSGAGAELRLRVAISNRIPLGIYLGIGQALYKEALDPQIYFGFANIF